MQIEWLNNDLTRARVTRGFWRRVAATVYRKTEHGVSVWYYEGRLHDPMVEGSFDGFLYGHRGIPRRLEKARQRELDRRNEQKREARDRELAELRRQDNPWQPVAKLPSARLLR
jgi:hypothetical protein